MRVNLSKKNFYSAGSVAMNFVFLPHFACFDYNKIFVKSMAEFFFSDSLHHTISVANSSAASQRICFANAETQF